MAIQDPGLTQVPGAISTGIGIDPTGVYSAEEVAAKYRWTVGDVAYCHRIGETAGQNPSERILVENVSNKALRFSQAAADVAPDGVVFTGYVNKTGVTLKTGQCCWAQQA